MAALLDFFQLVEIRPETSWPKSKPQNKRRKGDGQGSALLCALEARQLHSSRPATVQKDGGSSSNRLLFGNGFSPAE